MDFQAEKEVVRSYYKALNRASVQNVEEILGTYVSSDWHWRGYHPFNELIGASSVAAEFWQPFLKSFTSLQRREDIFFAGSNQIDQFRTKWVVSMGHLVGLFDSPFLKIPATEKMAFFRYCEFNRIENNQIIETAFFFDLPHLMVQAGLNPFPTQRGAQLVQPGPATHEGLLYDQQDPLEGTKTQKAIDSMITDLGTWQLGLPLEDELARTWHDDMIWWGPTGIGATYTIERYAKQHSGPFRAAFENRSFTGHLCRIAEGQYGGFFGWPNFTANLRGEYLGVPPSDVRGEFRVIDIYRREKSKLAENWVFIDLPHWMQQHDIIILPQ